MQSKSQRIVSIRRDRGESQKIEIRVIRRRQGLLIEPFKARDVAEITILIEAVPLGPKPWKRRSGVLQVSGARRMLRAILARAVCEICIADQPQDRGKTEP